MKNTSKKSEERAFTANEVGSMIERFDDSLKILAENYVGMDQRMGRIENKLESVDNRLGNVENKLELVETKIDRLQDDMVEVKFDLKRKVDAEQFEKLEKRVVKLEKISVSH
ncbi:MAG: hypothetical protein ACD_8C00109G0002 [uncultured bacterium]|nr:MAG: hypothetical protein ACD_8C00109G0002 [uncultured bacterium]